MDWAMKLLRELRELDQDYTYLTSQSTRLGRERYSKMYQEITRRRDSLRKELENHLDSK